MTFETYTHSKCIILYVIPMCQHGECKRLRKKYKGTKQLYFDTYYILIGLQNNVAVLEAQRKGWNNINIELNNVKKKY